jgi:hypothetical protein
MAHKGVVGSADAGSQLLFFILHFCRSKGFVIVSKTWFRGDGVFPGSVFGKSRQRQLIVAKLTKLYRFHLYKKTFI